MAEGRSRRRYIGFGLMAAFVLLMSLNFTGFCYPELRYYSDRELLDTGIAESLQWQYPTKESDRREYASTADFYAQNPNCCTLYRWDSREIDVWPRVFGFYVAKADIRYRASETVAEPFLHSEAFLSACGQVRRKQAIPEKRPRPSR